jgi:hypothetical protein
MSSYFSTFLHRVGQAVETVGQAGRPKTITGFQVSAFTVSCLVSSVILRGDAESTMVSLWEDAPHSTAPCRVL